ncbi:hypothetical protein BCR33DRAFT_711834 [Rhizoclosmatium globosum]|uniref:Uncharacterized protein n=1 Tax=Rhizoclosmatium globosum TaxID=329046 RepID=A0A1Y2CZU5_9FUNG|nr:hypothetical protein BCR33DRAFT_711834 [Rhizoclosmatium globosum]|eukprot:ORY52553.1 hypothetical protein BCR33DRAFT_711834 [Rhizoclosmatium globosum]
MYVWADKLSHFLDHGEDKEVKQRPIIVFAIDFKNKMKQADIITKMHFEPDIMLAHLIKLRKAAVERFLDNPIGLK